MPPRKLKITGGERRWDVKVEDAETGDLIENVVAIEWSYKAGDEWATAVITLADVAVELVDSHPGYNWVRP
jgi:hypothetical protein